MAATYDPTLPTDRDWVRLLCADRDLTNPVFQDAELDALVAEEANKYLAAARACEVMLARGHGVISKALDQLQIQYSDNIQGAFSVYIASLRAKGALLVGSTPRHFRVLL